MNVRTRETPRHAAQRRGALADESGAASVEFAVTLPFVAVALLLVAHVGLLAGAQVTIVHAAREGARAAAVWNDDTRARDAALEAGRLEPDRVEVTVAPAERAVGTPVSVTVRYRMPVRVPFIDRLGAREATLEATVTMRTEREHPPGDA